MVTPETQDQLKGNQQVTLPIPKFKWKNISTCSWILSISATAFGLLMMAGATIKILSIQLALGSALAMSALIGIVGLCLFINGIIAIARKTIFLQTKLAHQDLNVEEKKDEEKNEERAGCKSYLPSKKTVALGVLAAGGGTAGYFGGTAVAASAATLTGISASIFIGACAAGGAVMLSLLAYCCLGYNSRISSPRITAKRFAASQ